MTEKRGAARLLIIDDSIDILESLQMVLEDMGYQADTAASGFEALARVRSSNYALVLCDVGMPEMDGWRVAAEIRAISPATKIFLLTGGADQIRPGEPRLRAVDGVIGKPVELDRLETLIAKQLAPEMGRPAESAATA